ncbi:hypothetical protein [Mucilaginibacter myungsuensis]|uniref:Uncharacterized protein n=1 Tax=Mucilaginibacter myungsuensis TaxID=649104 RepID=A0A929KUT4_9SPHI|nr:hypothetical protein [Mucilaginibacter myungsuensis]MBE9660850.1 hypothetical protein [Mucilaginibacter myungsuensis]MDN3600897.1 hypothetical protein [Mucilaginibacter myungsuensis]
MRRLILIATIAAVAVACSSPENKAEQTDTLAADSAKTEHTQLTHPNDTAALTSMCFVRTEGTKHQDSTTVNLVVKGEKVTGEMMWLPHEKDARKGLLSGSLSGDSIKVVWTFMQEGMTDTMALHFKMAGDKLWQRPLKLNTKTGRQQTDAVANYSVEYVPFAGAQAK